MKRKDWPKVGTKMYSVHEHLYYVPGRAAPVMEYCVCEAEVQGYFQGGYVEICLVGNLPDRGLVPYHYPLKDVGSYVFYTPYEAAVLAEQITEKYERAWAGMKDPPLRRPWAYLLEDNK